MLSSLRMRLTLWYAGGFALVLILFSVTVYELVSRIQYERLNANLSATLQSVTSAVSGSQPASRALEGLGVPNQVVAVLDPSGKVLARHPATSAIPLRLPALRRSDSPQLYRLEESSPDADDSCRGIYQLVSNSATSASYFVAVVMSDELVSDQLDALQNVLTGAVILALALASSGGWFLAGRSLSPLAAMAAAAERITASNLAERVPAGNPRDELGRLAGRFNELLSRLDKAFDQQRQFMADASHQLRSPLSVIRSSAQVALQKPRREENEYRDSLTTIVQQAAQLTAIVDDMFALARADAGQLPLSPVNLYLDELTAEAVRASAVLGDRNGVGVSFKPLEEAPYRGDEGLLRQMILNLLDNAVKFTPPGGTVEVSLEREATGYSIAVEDTGPGIPAADQSHMFDRFYRGGALPARNGAGLGLPIARWIAEAHGGEARLDHSAVGRTRFVLRLPWTG